jgi:hypothetical protein
MDAPTPRAADRLSSGSKRPRTFRLGVFAASRQALSGSSGIRHLEKSPTPSAERARGATSQFHQLMQRSRREGNVTGKLVFPWRIPAVAMRVRAGPSSEPSSVRPKACEPAGRWAGGFLYDAASPQEARRGGQKGAPSGALPARLRRSRCDPSILHAPHAPPARDAGPAPCPAPA